MVGNDSTQMDTRDEVDNEIKETSEEDTVCCCIKGKGASWWKKTAHVENPWFFTACIFIGIIIGILFNVFADPASEHGKRWAFWLGFPGAIFLRAITVLIQPLIIFSMVAGVADLTANNKTSSVGKNVVRLYMVTTFMASLQGIAYVLMFKDSFVALPDKLPAVGGKVTLQCPGEGFVNVAASGALSCGALAPSDSSTFMLNSLDGKIAIKGAHPHKTFEDSISDIFYSLVPSNIFESYINGDNLAIVTFAIFFGVVTSSLSIKPKNNLVLSFCVQSSNVFTIMLTYVVQWSPLAISSLSISALAKQKDLSILLVNVGLLVVCCMLGFLSHICLVLTPMFKYYVGEWPLEYMKTCGPAYLLAFSCSSSASTLPLTMKCVDRTRKVSIALRKFILTLGATVNMDGTCIGYPCAIIFIAVASGHADLINARSVFTCAIVSAAGSVGTSPIPHSGLVMLTVLWHTIFPGIPIPPQVSYVQAIEFLLDRFETMTNVIGDTMVTRMVQAMQGEITEEELRILDAEADEQWIQALYDEHRNKM